MTVFWDKFFCDTEIRLISILNIFTAYKLIITHIELANCKSISLTVGEKPNTTVQYSSDIVYSLYCICIIAHY
jgi:hypothetical protein